jgi:formate hydrogenlyase subunit 3/multisubunit Na+/H+ antiporter MnhD subunit
VQPTLYAALLFEIIALLSVPLISPPGKPILRGVLRFLVFQTIGMCLVLLGYWLLPVVETTPADASQALRAAALMGLGLALTDAIFPFHTWVPMLAENAHPYAAAFIFFMLPTAVALIGLKYLEPYTNLSIAPRVYTALRSAGAFVIVTGGVWAAFQNHLGRILGFAATMQIGAGLLTLSLGEVTAFDPLFKGILYAQLLPQCVGLALWGLSLHAIQARTADLRFRKVQGLIRQMPVTTAGLVLSNLSLAGLPLLASFPVYVIVWPVLAQLSLNAALLSLVGNACLLVAGLRTLAVLLMYEKDQGWQISEHRLRSALLIVGSAVLLVVGMMPQWFLPPLVNMAFRYLVPGP